MVITSPAIDRLEVYRGLGVREVWFFEDGAFRLVTLRGDRCQPIPASEVLPEIELALIAEYARRPDQHAALRELRDRVRRRT